MKSGQEPVRPDRAVGQVAEHAVAFAPTQRLLRRRQRDRPDVLDPGQRVAGVNEVAQVPVATAGKGAETSRSERAPPSPAGAIAAMPMTSTAAGRKKLSLVPAAIPAARPTTANGPNAERQTPHLPASGAAPRVGPGQSQPQQAGRRCRRCRCAPLQLDRQALASSRQSRPAPAKTARPCMAGRCTNKQPGSRRTSRGSAAATANPDRTPASPPRGTPPSSPGRTRPGTAGR